MRLYVNKKEVPLLKRALAQFVTLEMIESDKECARTITQLLERVELCEKLQDNEKKAVKDELNGEYDFAEVLSDESY